jgi:hypothetical protein
MSALVLGMIYLVVGIGFAWRDAKLHAEVSDDWLTRVILAILYVTGWPLWLLTRVAMRLWR